MMPIDFNILSAIVSDTPGYVIVLDTDLNIEFINQSGPGLPINELLGTPIVSYLPRASQNENAAILRGVLATRESKSYSVALRGREGKSIRYETTAVPLVVNGELRGITLHARDGTSEALVEDRRAALQGLMEKAEEVSHFGSFEIQLGPEGERVNLSHQMCKILGIDPRNEAPPIAVHLEKFTHPDDRQYVRSAVQRALRHGVPFEIDYRTLTPAGETRWLRSKTEPTIDAQGRTTGLVGIVHDITDERRCEAERRQLEAQLRQSQKMEAIGTLASGVAHDFNNLLMGVSGCARVALDKLPADSPSRSFIDEILRAVQSGAAITRQLLTFTRKSTAEPLVFDVNAAVAAQKTMLAHLLGEQTEVVLRLQSEPCWIRLDPTQFEQVLMNLVVNARHAMPDGGRLLIETQMPKARAQSGLGGAKVLLVVSDTGTGMSESTCERIFEPFSTTKEVGEGTGLGLSTAYAIVQQAGGDIEVESREGEGTSFRIVFPTAEAPITTIDPDPEPREKVRKGHETILLVEDDSLVRLATVYYLKEAGYRVLEAGSGAEAIECWRDYPGDIDVLLTDVVLPKVNGPQLVRAIQELNPNIKVLFMSAHGADWVAAKWPIDPDVRLLQKPFDKETLVSGVREVLST